jgi:hypothetical protein
MIFGFHIEFLIFLYYDGQAGECMMEAEEVLKLHDYITRVFVLKS